MNPLKFGSSKVNKDPKEYIDDINKVTQIIGIYIEKSVDLVDYILKGVAHALFQQWKEDKGTKAGLVL